MKNTILFALLVVMFLLSGIGVDVSAATIVCGNPDHSTSLITYTSCGNGNPENVMNVWGTTNNQLPHIKQGQSYVMSNGVTDTCPWWFPMYCVDISRTQYFIDRWGR